MGAAHVANQMAGFDVFSPAKVLTNTGYLVVPGGDQEDVAVACHSGGIRVWMALGGISGPGNFIVMAVEIATDRYAMAVQVTPKGGGNFSGAYKSDLHGPISRQKSIVGLNDRYYLMPCDPPNVKSYDSR
jgi:hypothetical protein